MPNIVGLLSALQREVIKPNDCEIIQAVDKSHSIHIYNYDLDDAAKVKRVTVSPQIMR